MNKESEHSPSDAASNAEKTCGKSLEEIREYVQESYWESGKTDGISGYEKKSINWFWINRWMQCFNQVFPIRDKVLLDLGCGIGEMVAAGITWGADSYGIDISDYAIKKGKQEAEYLEQRLYQGSIHDLSRWGNDAIDIIYSNQVFEHLPEKYVEKLVSEMFRILRPGGFCWLAFVTSTEENGVRGENDTDKTHINLHNMDWWRKRFFKAGFKERKDLDSDLRKTTAGYDHFNYFDCYGWDSIVLQK